MEAELFNSPLVFLVFLILFGIGLFRSIYFCYDFCHEHWTKFWSWVFRPAPPTTSTVVTTIYNIGLLQVVQMELEEEAERTQNTQDQATNTTADPENTDDVPVVVVVKDPKKELKKPEELKKESKKPEEPKERPIDVFRRERLLSECRRRAISPTPSTISDATTATLPNPDDSFEVLSNGDNAEQDVVNRPLYMTHAQHVEEMEIRKTLEDWELVDME